MKAKLSIAALLLLAAIGGYLYWNKTQQTIALVAAAVPEIPTASIESAPLLKRIQNASTQAKQGPNPVAALQELSSLYHANGFTREAWQCYATLVVVEPVNPLWPYRFGRILAGYGQLEEATPWFEKAVSLNKTYAPSYFRLGETLLKQNRYDEAAKAFDKILELEPINPYARVGLARIDIAREDWPAAREKLEKAVTDSGFQIGADLLGDVYEKLNLKQKELVVLQNIRWGSYADMPDPWSLTLMNDSYDAYQISIAGGWVVHQGDVQTGLRYVKRAYELDPENTAINYQIGGIYLQLNELDKAEEHFKRCVDVQPDFADAWLQLLEIAERRQSPTTYRRLLDSALRAAPDSPSLQIKKGKQLMSQNRVEQALACFERSIELRPHEAVGYVEYAQALISADRVDEGLAQIQLALKREPTHRVALATMAFDAIQKGDRANADLWLSRLTEQPRITKEEYQQLSTLYRRTFGENPKF